MAQTIENIVEPNDAGLTRRWCHSRSSRIRERLCVHGQRMHESSVP